MVLGLWEFDTGDRKKYCSKHTKEIISVAEPFITL